MTLVPCDLHELTNCAICSGADKTYIETLRETIPDGPPPRIPGNVVIWARFFGYCVGCGRPYQVGAAIRRPSRGVDHGGWFAVDCCPDD